MMASKPPDSAAIALELRRVASSALFAKAYRCCTLLSYVISNADRVHLNEYAIGIAVFGRSAATYDTGDDPIVRVQAGRLRARLSAYYAGEGRSNPLRISIPLGGYLARVDWAVPCNTTKRLTFRPLVCLSAEAPAQSFTLGINEELGYRLHREFGERPPATAYALEGSVRKDGPSVRISLRLLDLDQDRLIWCEQIDHPFDTSIVCQEQVAAACSGALRRHMARDGAVLALR